MNDPLKKEVYSFIKGVQKKKLIILLSLPAVIYFLYRMILRFVQNKTDVHINRFVLAAVCILLMASIVPIIMNVADRVNLRKRLDNITDKKELELLQDDFRFGTLYLNNNVIIGNKYIFSKGSSRLFSFDELNGIFDDIRDTYNVLTMILAGADDVVKTKIIKAEYKGKNFLHDRRICSIEVHDRYTSAVGETDGYEQLRLIEEEIRNKLKMYRDVSII